MSRQLAAIMFTDIVGYTALMGKDESKAMDILQRNKSIQETLIANYGGTFLKELGDGTLASFPTASQAVECGASILNEAKEADIPLRIGIHVGEVVMKGNDVYGDGVNIASRLEQQSPKGGMAISDSVYSNVRNKSDLVFRDAGIVKLKNVASTIRVYKIGEEEVTADLGKWKSVTKAIAAFSILILLALYIWFYLPSVRDTQQDDNVTLVVLPFDVLGIESGASFADGLQDDILNLLTADDNLKVVSRTSAINYQKSGLSVAEMADRHNISHVLEGSIRKIGDRYKIVVKLIDAVTDTNLWSTTIDGGGDDLAGFESSTAEKLAEYIQLSLSTDIDLPTNSIEAYDLYVNAENLVAERLPGANMEAVSLARQAIDIDPKFPEPYGVISSAYADRVIIFGNEPFWADSAVLYAKKMVQLEPESGEAHRALGFAMWAQKGAKAAMIEFKKAATLGHKIDVQS